MRKMLPPQVPRHRWQAQTPRLMSNPKPTVKAKSGAEAVLLQPGRFRLRHHPPVTSFSGSLEHTRDRHLRRRLRRPAAGADQHNESLVRNTAAEQNRQFNHGYSTTSIL
jgi:hypothetical protein